MKGTQGVPYRLEMETGNGYCPAITAVSCKKTSYGKKRRHLGQSRFGFYMFLQKTSFRLTPFLGPHLDRSRLRSPFDAFIFP